MGDWELCSWEEHPTVDTGGSEHVDESKIEDLEGRTHHQIVKSYGVSKGRQESS
jgi:hypothetical protein